MLKTQHARFYAIMSRENLFLSFNGPPLLGGVLADKPSVFECCLPVISMQNTNLTM